MKVLQFPLTRITLGFISGILFAYYFHPPLLVLFVLLSISISVFGVLYFLLKNKSKNVFYFGLSAYLLSFLIGISTQVVHTDHFKKSNYVHNPAFFEQATLQSCDWALRACSR